MKVDNMEEVLLDKYERLLKNHQCLQDINNDLESKILTLVERYEKEKQENLERIQVLSRQVYNLSTAISEIEKENERYKRDCSLAVHLLRCKPNSYVDQRFNSLPEDYQKRLENRGWTDENARVIPHPTQGHSFFTGSTFPPTAGGALFLTQTPASNSDRAIDSDSSICPKCAKCYAGQVVPNVLVANLLLESYYNSQYMPNQEAVDDGALGSLNKNEGGGHHKKSSSLGLFKDACEVVSSKRILSDQKLNDRIL